MTQTELVVALKSTGLPAAYGEFAEPTAPPFICYQFAYSGDMMADNQNYAEISNFQIELYSKNKDPASEKKVQDLLKSLKLPYSKIEAYLESEKLRQVVYEIQVLGG